MKETNQKLKEHVTVKYTHPGTYRAFVFKEKILTDKKSNKDENYFQIVKKMKYVQLKSKNNDKKN